MLSEAGLPGALPHRPVHPLEHPRMLSPAGSGLNEKGGHLEVFPDGPPWFRRSNRLLPLPVVQGARDYAACYPAARYLLTLESAGGSYCRSSLIVTKR